MSIWSNLEKIRAALPGHVTLVAVSKTFPVKDILEAYEAGQRDFGENRVQELMAKQPELPGDIRWHQIGHLQSNKVKYIIPFVHLIHAVDSPGLLQEISKQAQKHEKQVSVLLQIHIAEEEHKFGFQYEEAADIIRNHDPEGLVKIKGLMGMATNTPDQEKVRKEFRRLSDFFNELKKAHPWLDTLSMGMSGDYPVAVAEGSTMVRVGSAVFGKR